MKTVQFRQAICEAMSEEMRRDETIYLMGEEVAEYNGAYKASKGMLDEFGDLRVIDTPISEAGFSGVGVGSTMVGARPIIEFITFNFALVGIDQIINHAAKIRQTSGGQLPCPIVFRGPTASAGQLRATHTVPRKPLSASVFKRHISLSHNCCLALRSADKYSHNSSCGMSRVLYPFLEYSFRVSCFLVSFS